MYQNREFKHRSFRESFRNARKGLTYAFTHERNIRRMTFLGTTAVIAGFVFGISRIEWLALVLTVGLVFSAELINTLVEYLCDLFRHKYDHRVKVLKDLASAIPLFASGLSLIVAILIFVPKFFR